MRVKYIKKFISTICLILFFTLAMLSGHIINNHVYADISSWQKSVSIVPKSSTDFSSDSFKQSVKNYANTKGNYVTLIIPYYQSSMTSSDLKAGSNTPTDASIRDAIRYAKSLGLKVALKPHAEVSSGGWRGNIDPSNRSTWFAAYQNILSNLATIGAQEGVDEIVIGTELRKVSSDTYNSSNTSYWLNMIGKVRSIFSGKLSYSAQWSGGGASDPLDEKQTIKFWDKLDYLGLSAYWPLAASDTNPTTDTLKNAWASIEKSTIAPLQQKFNKAIVFTELGYRSLHNANAYPWDYSKTGTVDTALQSRLYDAMYAFWSGKSYFQGIHWWEWESNPNAGGNNTTFTPQNKPAQITMTNWNGGATTAPPPPSNIIYSVTATNSPAQPNINQTVTITEKVTTSTNVSNQLVDIEIYNQAGNRIFQKYYSNQNLSPSGTTYTFTWTPTTNETFTLKTGIFKNDWSTLYYWNGNVLKITTGGSTTATYTTSTSANPTNPAVNQTTTITTQVTASSAQSNLTVDIEIYNSANSRVFQKYFSGQTLSANTAKSFVATWTPNTTGTYTVKVGIFSGGWATQVYWNNKALTLSVGTTATTALLKTLSSETSVSNNSLVVAGTEPSTKPLEKVKPETPPLNTNTAPTANVNNNAQQKETYEIEVIAPTENSQLSGKILIKAFVKDLPIDKYDMYVVINGEKPKLMRGIPETQTGGKRTQKGLKEIEYDLSKLKLLDNKVITLELKAKLKGGTWIAGIKQTFSQKIKP